MRRPGLGLRRNGPLARRGWSSRGLGSLAWKLGILAMTFAVGCDVSDTEAPPESTGDDFSEAQHELEANKADLDFILRQIKIAEQHAAGVPLSSLVESPLLPFGLRTVDGSFNNIEPGQELFGSSDRDFPRLLPIMLRDAEPATFDPDGPGPLTVGSPSSYTQFDGLVFDSQIRMASNLIVDQSAANPAAVAAAAQTDGSIANVGGSDSFFIPNVAPDVGLSAPYNAWFTFFGQFFDHGLDLVDKGGSGTVFIPLREDDPLFVPGSPTNFMVLDRATNKPGPDGILGTGDDERVHHNNTTPFVDQNQTYTSHPSHQVFLREYALDGSGRPVSTGRLLDGARDGLANWREVKEQALTVLGIVLTDADVFDVPLVATDPYGKFIPGPSGFPQVVFGGSLVEASLGSPLSVAGASRTGQAFLDDIAHSAAPKPGLLPDPDGVVTPAPQPAGTYDDELLAEHRCTGDGRGNENIGLTAVHSIFHAEHNRLVQATKDLVIATVNPTYIAEWLLPGANLGDGVQESEWNGERLFQAARFGTEMQYQHLVFEEFARKVQPEVNPFIGYDSTIDAAIVAEFAHTVYRFGHSMLNENVSRRDLSGVQNDIGLIEAFLNPLEFASSGATDMESTANIVRGTTRQVGNELDEFVTGALRNNLLGLPLDLATINLARGRDTGVPPLNEARRIFYAQTSNSALLPYESWMDFGFSMRHFESLTNFVAAYGTHPDLVAAPTLEQKRAVAAAIVGAADGTVAPADAPADAVDFMFSSGSWAGVETGIDLVDFWIGGLAERQMVFGGLLGPTFNFVFEVQLEKLQDGDRLYYLSRTASLNFLTQLEQNTFAELIMRNTDVRNLPADSFSYPAFIADLRNLGASGPILDDPLTTDVDESVELRRMPDGTVRYTGIEHIVMGGTEGADRMRGSEGDDTFWGHGGNDRIEGGDGNDSLNGNDGDDIITDLNGIDNYKGGPGNDAISAGPGNGDLILAGAGKDFTVGGPDFKETFGGSGDDFIMAGDAENVVFGGEGDDWIEGGDQADLIQGDNGDPFEESPLRGNDVLIGQSGADDYDAESGDDIMVTDPNVERHHGMLGFDWVTHKGSPAPADDDMFFTGLRPDTLDNLRDRFDLVEAVSGWDLDDIIRGDDVVAADLLNTDPEAGFNNALNDASQIALIDGLQDVLGAGVTSFAGGNILLGGGGSDILEGRGGDDILDGDRWLNVRLAIRDGVGAERGWADVMNGVIQDKSGFLAGTDPSLTLLDAVFAGLVNPAQIHIVREILVAPGVLDVDTAVFSGASAEYVITLNPDGSLRVAHVGGTALDGVDTLRNIEQLSFLDGTIPAASIIAPSDTIPPAPVTNLVLTPDGAAITLTFTAPPDAVSVTTLRSTVGFASSPTDLVNQLDASDVDLTTLIDTDVVIGTTYFYTLFARDAAGNFSAPTTGSTTATFPAPTATLTATVAVINPGESVTLTFSSTNATSATLTPGPIPVGTLGSVVVTPAATTTYTYTATGLGGSASASVTVTVTAAAPVIGAVTIDQARVQRTRLRVRGTVAPDQPSNTVAARVDVFRGLPSLGGTSCPGTRLGSTPVDPLTGDFDFRATFGSVFAVPTQVCVQSSSGAVATSPVTP